MANAGNKRAHTRFDEIDIRGRITLVNMVDIIDISQGGVALKIDRKLEVGREYRIQLGDKDRNIEVRGSVVRSTLVGMETGANGDSVLLYTASVKFKEGSEEKVTSFLNSIEHGAKIKRE